MSLVIFLGLIGVVLLYFIMLYNNLIQLKHNVTKSWSNIDVLLKQRHDELPKLVEACKQYMQFEQATLEKVMQARAGVAAARETRNIGALGTAETSLRAGLRSLFATVEAYPELKTNEQFQYLIARISELENSIADRREFYNETVNLNNVRIEQFPDVIIARFFNFEAAQTLEFTAEDRRDTDLSSLFTPGS